MPRTLPETYQESRLKSRSRDCGTPHLDKVLRLSQQSATGQPRDKQGKWVETGSRKRFATRADDRRLSGQQTRSNFLHPETGHVMGKSETGDTYEALFAAKGAKLLAGTYGDYTPIAGRGNRTTALDFKAGQHGGELKTLNARTPNQKTAIKADEVARKDAAVKQAGLKPLIVVQVVDQDSGRVDVYAHDAFASKRVSRMAKIGSYEYSQTDFRRAQEVSGHYEKRTARASR